MSAVSPSALLVKPRDSRDLERSDVGHIEMARKRVGNGRREKRTR